jgi:hypothetical protein
VLAALLGLEAAAMVVLTVVLVVDVLVLPADSLASALALTVTVGVGAVGVIAVAVGLWRLRPWTRGAALVVQVLLGAVGLGALQGVFAQPAIGWALIVPAVAGVVLVLSKPVTAALQRDET